MKLKDLFSWAGFTGIGGGVADGMSIPDDSKGFFSLSFGSKFLIAAGLTVIGLYTIKRILK